MWPFTRAKKLATSRGDLGLINLPSNVDDNLYLAAASKAAFADIQSGAYDEFLFSDEAHRKMPFEYALETHTRLISSRLEDQGRREIERRQKLVFQTNSKIAKMSQRLEQLKAKLKTNEENLQRQQSILDGREKGDHEMYWTDSIPHVASTISARFRLWSHGIIFVLVAAIDFGILKLSFQSLPGFNEGWDAVLLTFPALGIQVVFPHLLGERLAYIMRGHPRKKHNRNEAAFLALGWIAFVLVITLIRINFISQQGGSTISNQQAMAKLQPAITGLSLLMLIGLGAWMILLASRRNPHKNEYLHLLLAKQKLTNKCSSAEIDFLSAEGELPPLELSLQVAKESYNDAVQIVKQEVSESARMVYR
ncbi:MAG: hypothetical protein WCQ11_05325, partial [Actinomycetes bacterium]